MQYLKMSELSNPSFYIGTTGLVVAIGGSIYNNQQIKSLTDVVNTQGQALKGYIQKLKDLQSLDKSTKEAVSAVRELKEITEGVMDTNEQMKPLIQSIANQQIITQHYLKEMMKSIEHINNYISDQGGEVYKPQPFDSRNTHRNNERAAYQNVESRPHPQNDLDHRLNNYQHSNKTQAPPQSTQPQSTQPHSAQGLNPNGNFAPQYHQHHQRPQPQSQGLNFQDNSGPEYQMLNNQYQSQPQSTQAANHGRSIQGRSQHNAQYSNAHHSKSRQVAFDEDPESQLAAMRNES